MIRGPRTFTFNNQVSEDFGIIINKVHRPILPTLRSRTLVIPGKDGVWDFGGNTYEELTISIDCTLAEPLDKIPLTRLIAGWLTPKSELIISDEPERYYVGRLYDSIIPEIEGPVGTFTLTFILEPFAYSVVETTDEILLGDDVPLASGVLLGNSEQYSITLTGAGTLTVYNFGTRNIRPYISMIGSFDNVSITINGKNLTYQSSILSQELVIDGSNYTVEVDGVNKLSEITGDIYDFLTLEPGDNTIEMSGTNLNCLIQFKFRPMFY